MGRSRPTGLRLRSSFEMTGVAWVVTRMAHAKTIQTTIPFARAFG